MEWLMSEPLTPQEVITAAIALVAVVISFVSFHRTSKVQRQQLFFQKKQVELIDLQLESIRRQAAAPQVPIAEKADVRIDLEQQGRDYKFVITNWGRVPARNVTFELDLKEGQQSPLVADDYNEKIPISELGPGARCPLWAALKFGTGTAFQARWTWLNPDGSQEKRSSFLAI
jgi:hypothetical protein